MQPDMPLPDDIVAKVARDFPAAADRAYVLHALATVGGIERNRVARCVLFCAAGDLAAFRSMEALARLDYRDAIMCGEYEYPSCKRLRSFNEPFAS
jgi:hypothetical protein